MRGPAFLATLVFVLASCAPSAAAPAPSGTQPAPAPTASTVRASATAQASRTAAPYLSIGLTDVRNGERFTLSSFVGKTVIVEGMAVW